MEEDKKCDEKKEEEEKKIVINGTNNRYQIKKLTKTDNFTKKRKVYEKLENVLYDYFSNEKQEMLIKTLFDELQSEKEKEKEKEKESERKSEINTNVLKRELNKKISSYKQQDIMRKIFDSEKFIDLEIIVSKLHECKLSCYYCKGNMFVFYELTREMKQWSVDRINNDLGHNRDNIMMACLDCNLKRRCKNKDAFLFTKQLSIVKSETTNGL